MNKLIFCILFMVPFISGTNAAEATPRSRNITEFFPQAKGNLTKITWAHAVNNQDLLKEALNGTVMMLEADVLLGKVKGGSSEDIPIMGHPPATESDLSLQDFLQKIQDFNTNDSNTAKKGVKLDFKSIEVFEASTSFLKELYPKMDYPVWINADILAGPVDATTKPVDAQKFIKAATEFENATLSLGWTTQYGKETTNASYTDKQVNEMLNIIRQNNIQHPITFPVRAGIAAHSLCQLGELVENVTDSTLTLWTSKDDHVDVDLLVVLISEVGIDRVFIDLPDDLQEQLHLDQLSGSSLAKPFVLTSTVLAGILAVF